MRSIPRDIAPVVLKAARQFPAVLVTGPRRAGKTYLLRKLFPHAQYVLLENPDTVERARRDPRGLLDELKTPAILDEIQNVPELFAYIRARIDAAPSRKGQWLITGSQEAPLMQHVSESMAGRAAILNLMPLSYRELGKVSLVIGGFAEVLAAPTGRQLWYDSYIQTYLERDLRQILNVRDLATFRRFLSLLAARHGQQLNRTDLSGPLGVSVPTISQWLNVLEITGQILVLPPWFENVGKRIAKSPKVYIADSGMACHLLGIESLRLLEKSPFLGAICEGYITAETLKNQVNAGRRREAYYYRDKDGLEVDLVLPEANARWRLVEVKASHTVRPQMAEPIRRLQHALGERFACGCVVHRASKGGNDTQAMMPGIQALTFEQFLSGQ